MHTAYWHKSVFSVVMCLSRQVDSLVSRLRKDNGRIPYNDSWGVRYDSVTAFTNNRTWPPPYDMRILDFVNISIINRLELPYIFAKVFVSVYVFCNEDLRLWVKARKRSLEAKNQDPLDFQVWASVKQLLNWRAAQNHPQGLCKISLKKYGQYPISPLCKLKVIY